MGSRGEDEPVFDRLSKEDLDKLQLLYDKNRDGKLSADEILEIVNDYNTKKAEMDPEIVKILSKYDLNHDGKIDVDEHEELANSLSLQDSNFRYSGYTVGLSRLFRYLAFTSDFGEALRPVVHRGIVTATYGVAFVYCFADVGWEAYKVHQCHVDPKSPYLHGHDGKKYASMSVTQCVVERSTFQALASLALPAVIIHQSVHAANNMFKRMGRFTKWGPSVVGLSIIPLMPTFLDEPVEKIVEYGFHHYGPWAAKKHQD